jgi:hypothetical protein
VISFLVQIAGRAGGQTRRTTSAGLASKLWVIQSFGLYGSVCVPVLRAGCAWHGGAAGSGYGVPGLLSVMLCGHKKLAVAAVVLKLMELYVQVFRHSAASRLAWTYQCPLGASLFYVNSTVMRLRKMAVL